jgi:SAM-dependent methyltransferase
MLLRVLANLFRASTARPAAGIPAPRDYPGPAVLDVGSGSREIPLPLHYAGWRRYLLDVNPATGPDIVLDARELAQLGAARFDGVYCSHNLEHYYAHEVKRILGGFLHVLKPGGFVEIRVPDLAAVARRISQPGNELDDVLYTSPAGPITARDVIYGLERWIEKSGEGFFAHKTGFTQGTLGRALRDAGFADVHWLEALGEFELRAVATCAPADERVRTMFALAAGRPG